MTGHLVLSAETALFLWRAAGSEVEACELPFGLVARRGALGGVDFSPLGSADGLAPDEIAIERLGAQLADCDDADLLAHLLGGFFAAAARLLPAAAREAPYLLLHPPWLGPRERTLLRDTARPAGLSVAEGFERGLAPVEAEICRDPAAAPGGWVVADRCGPDLDVYTIAGERLGERRVLSIASYRRCPGLFSARYQGSRHAAAAEAASALRPAPAGWPLLVSDASETMARLLAATRPAAKVVSFAEHLAALPATAGEGRLPFAASRKHRYWLDHGDEALQPLEQSGDGFASCQRLFRIPDAPPSSLYLAIRAGFGATREETHEVARIVLTRPHQFQLAPGHLLVSASRAGDARGELTVEVFQQARCVYRQTEGFPL